MTWGNRYFRASMMAARSGAMGPAFLLMIGKYGTDATMGRRVVWRAIEPAMKFFSRRQAKNEKLTYIFLLRSCSMKVMALMRSPGLAPRAVPIYSGGFR